MLGQKLTTMKWVGWIRMSVHTVMIAKKTNNFIRYLSTYLNRNEINFQGYVKYFIINIILKNTDKNEHIKLQHDTRKFIGLKECKRHVKKYI